MPTNWLTGLRTKYIHSVGVVGKVKLVLKGANPYTGLFKKADYGLVRFSSAAPPSATDLNSPLTPGLGLKFLRDNVDSANLVAMKGVNGQPGNWNFFADDFNTIIPTAKGAALIAVATKFATETLYIQEAALSNLASTD